VIPPDYVATEEERRRLEQEELIERQAREVRGRSGALEENIFPELLSLKKTCRCFSFGRGGGGDLEKPEDL